eukprot:scaffold616_cov257-Pinguiococcus_pyrenoidosus.AAC.16
MFGSHASAQASPAGRLSIATPSGFAKLVLRHFFAACSALLSICSWPPGFGKGDTLIAMPLLHLISCSNTGSQTRAQKLKRSFPLPRKP